MLVKVEITTFRDHSVRAGYTYDDQTFEVLEFWCDNDTGLKMDLKSSALSKIEQFRRDEQTTVDVSAKGLVLVEVKNEETGEVTLVLPVNFETRYAWQ